VAIVLDRIISHEVYRVECGLLSYCCKCHLLWPCLDGRILAAPQQGQNHWFTVDEIRRRLLASLSGS
jgi:hypothetical protein